MNRKKLFFPKLQNRILKAQCNPIPNIFRSIEYQSTTEIIQLASYECHKYSGVSAYTNILLGSLVFVLSAQCTPLYMLVALYSVHHCTRCVRAHQCVRSAHHCARCIIAHKARHVHEDRPCDAVSTHPIHNEQTNYQSSNGCKHR